MRSLGGLAAAGCVWGGEPGLGAEPSRRATASAGLAQTLIVQLGNAAVTDPPGWGGAEKQQIPSGVC